MVAFAAWIAADFAALIASVSGPSRDPADFADGCH